MPRQTPSEVNIFTQKPNSELEFGSERILFRMNYLQAAVARAAARNWRQDEMAGQEVSIYSTLSSSHWNSPLIKVLQSCVNQREPEQKWGPSQTAVTTSGLTPALSTQGYNCTLYNHPQPLPRPPAPIWHMLLSPTPTKEALQYLAWGQQHSTPFPP